MTTTESHIGKHPHISNTPVLSYSLPHKTDVFSAFDLESALRFIFSPVRSANESGGGLFKDGGGMCEICRKGEMKN